MKHGIDTHAQAREIIGEAIYDVASHLDETIYDVASHLDETEYHEVMDEIKHLLCTAEITITWPEGDSEGEGGA